jgi:metal-dependent amidase/aminoacylase/carboxypeptidase family protein
LWGDCTDQAILLCVARILAGQRDTLKGSVKFLFQPAEEGGAGAKAMIEDGCMENPTGMENEGC